MPRPRLPNRSQRWAYGLLLLAGCALTSAAGTQTPATPNISAPSYLLMETRSGTELAAHNADARRAPASLTKLMTAYVLFGELRAGRLHLDDRATVSRTAARLPGARMFLSAGEGVAIEDLIKGMLVHSGNDATFTLVEHVSDGLPAFVARMNAEAARLSLTHTHFANATGLQNPQHYSTARDLARLAFALRRDFPEYLGWFRLREYTWAGITQPNRNLLLARMPEVDGLKTGHTEAAGYCLAVSATHADMQLVAVLLGNDSEAARARDGRRLLEHGLHHFETRRLYPADSTFASLPVWLGTENHVALGISDDLWLTLPRGDFERLQARMLLPDTLHAPIVQHATLGRLQLLVDGEQQREIPLVALTAVAEGGLVRRTANRVHLWWRAGGQAQAAP